MTESSALPESQRCTYRAELELHETSFMSRCELRAGHRGGHLAELPALPSLDGSPARTRHAAVLHPGSGTREDHAVRREAVQYEAVQHGAVQYEKEDIH
ncbi:hypothetical protein J2W21_001217 [Sinomonas atrocyanea]|uniref:hypothetical protein n=1 Tax=Sinomonas atrocyanea TaxID=37927 RepID=UPI00278445AC|nr:hypothetical protein [Sinomonas atrocyanea]MDP9883723.1 hypothetical protein [Sinomonas atrocyanea]